MASKRRWRPRGEWPRTGEFRSGQRAHLPPGVLGPHVIKQSNQECEDLLAHWAELFSTWSDILKKQVGPEWKSRCRRRRRTCRSRRRPNRSRR
jgi:hypothetical protein